MLQQHTIRYLPLPLASILLCLLLLPLVHWQGAALSAAVPKAAFFTSVVLLIGGATLWQTARARSRNVPPRSVLIALACFLVAALLSSLFSSFPMESLRGGSVRGVGFLDLIVLTLFGWCAFLFCSMDRLRTISWMIALAGSLAVLPGLWEIVQGTGDIRAAMGVTMGHPNFLGQLLVLTGTLTVTLFLRERGGMRLLLIALLVLQATGLLLSGSRAALLGALVGIGIVLAVRAGTDQRLRLWMMGFAAVILLLVGVINAAPSTPVVQRVPLLQRLVLVSDGAQTQSLSVRRALWTMALAGIADRPLLGHGIGAVPAVLEQHFDPALLDLERYDALPDRVHNDVLERLLAGGMLGLAAWMVLAFLVLRSGWTAFRESRNPLLPGILAALAGHFVALLFGFPTIVDLAFVTVLAAVLLQSDATTTQLRPAAGITAGIVLLLVTAFALTDDVRALAADRFFLRWTITADRYAALPALERAHALAPHAGYAPYLATEHVALGRNGNAADLLHAALHNGRPDAALLALRGWVLLRGGDDDAARVDFDRAAALAPFTPFVWRTMGTAWLEAGRGAEAVSAFEHLIAFSPRYWEWDGTVAERTPEEQRRYHVFFQQNPDFRSLLLQMEEARRMAGEGGVEEDQ